MALGAVYTQAGDPADVVKPSKATSLAIPVRVKS